jgi:hypothetical protein
MALDVPPDGYFFDTSGVAIVSTGQDVAQPAPSQAVPPSDAGANGVKPKALGGAGGVLHLEDTASGEVTGPLQAAIAGFVVYEDANGNDALDINGAAASSPDTLLGGAEDLLLVYFRGGGALDYERLSDKSGVLPSPGYNLAATEGRWFPLDLVELKLGAAHLPSQVCSGSGPKTSSDNGNSGPSVKDAGRGPSDAAANPFPSPNDPRLHCSSDGRTFSYTFDCPTPPPPVVGLCSSGNSSRPYCAGYSEAMPNGGPVPVGWPCPVAGVPDAGSSEPDASPPRDAGVADVGTNG